MILMLENLLRENCDLCEMVVPHYYENYSKRDSCSGGEIVIPNELCLPTSALRKMLL